MKRILSTILWLVLLFCQPIGAFCAENSEKPKQDYWMGIYYDKVKIGSAHIIVAKGQVNGKEGWIRNEALRIRFKIASNSYSYNINRTISADENYGPVSVKYTADGKEPLQEGTYTYDVSYGSTSSKLKTITNQVVNETTLPFTKEERNDVTNGNMYDLGGKKLLLGEKCAIDHFRNDIDVSLEPRVGHRFSDGMIYVLRKETIIINDTPYNALVVLETDDDYIIRWHMENGEVLKEEIPAANIVFIREVKEKATEIDEKEVSSVNPLPPFPPSKQIDLKSIDQSPKPVDYWMGIYSGSTKIGYLHTTIKHDKLDDKDVIRKDEALHTHAKLYGDDINCNINHTLYVDSKYNPVLETFQLVNEISSQSREDSISGEFKYGQDAFDSKVTMNGKTYTQTLSLSKEDKEVNMASCMYDFGVLSLDAGQKIGMHHLFFSAYPDGVFGININDTSLNVLRRETLDLDGKSHDVLVVSERSKDGQETIKWQLESGEVLKAEMALGSIRFVRETQEKATKL